MKTWIGILFIALYSAGASADIIKKATMDITCTEVKAKNPRTFRIVSNAQGSTVTIGKKEYKDKQLIGGTEGGDPYLQAVNSAGRYNITIYGGDFKTAVYSSQPIENGKASASVGLFNPDQTFTAECKGSFLFTSAF